MPDIDQPLRESTAEIQSAILLMTPDPKAIGRVLARVLQRSTAAQAVPIQSLEILWDRIADAAIGWMSTHQTKRVEALSHLFTSDQSIDLSGAGVLERLSCHEWLAVHLRVLARVLAVQRERQSADETLEALYSLITDRRHAKWRQVLMHFHAHNRAPIAASALLTAKIFNSPQAANQALARMAELGFLLKLQVPGARYALTPTADALIGLMRRREQPPVPIPQAGSQDDFRRQLATKDEEVRALQEELAHVRSLLASTNVLETKQRETQVGQAVELLRRLSSFHLSQRQMAVARSIPMDYRMTMEPAEPEPTADSAAASTPYYRTSHSAEPLLPVLVE